MEKDKRFETSFKSQVRYSPHTTFFSFLLVLLLFTFQANISKAQLTKAIKNGNVKEVERLIASGEDVNEISLFTPLYYAVVEGNIEIVRLLLENKADVNKPIAKDKRSASPLQSAISNNKSEIVKLLLESGADIDYVCRVNGYNAMMYAQSKGYSHIVEILKKEEVSRIQKLIANTQSKPTAINNQAVLQQSTSDVDINVPYSNIKKPNAYALIIGNEDYSSFQTGLSTESNVDFAINDAKIFKEYCIKTLGVPEKQIKILLNATTGHMNQGLAWLKELAQIEDGNAELIFYYSGHGLPEEQSKEPYLIPVDISGNNVSLGIKLADVYNGLSEFPSKRVTVFLDACFSGGARNQGLIAMKGVKVQPKENMITGNLIVISSSSGTESSGVYREQQHGYMTYFLLKKLQETKGNIKLAELFNYVIETVRKESALNGKSQTPVVNISPTIEDVWYSWNLD